MQINTNPRAKSRIKLTVAEKATVAKTRQLLTDLSGVLSEPEKRLAVTANTALTSLTDVLFRE
jgi:hypothetical protein